jgi:hypothetical protein
MAAHGDESRVQGGCAMATAGVWYGEAVECRREVRWVEVQVDGGNVVEGMVRDSNTAIERWVKEKACAAMEPIGPS